MRILGAFVLIVALIAGVGFYRGWFRVASDTGSDSSNYTLTVDKDQIRDDKDAAAEKVGDIGHDAKEAVSSDDDDDDDGDMDDKTSKVIVDEPGRTVIDGAAVDQHAAQGWSSHDGVLVSLGDMLTMTDTEQIQHEHAVAANVTITCDGNVATAAALRPGMRISVTTQRAAPHMATRIEALDHSDVFAPTG